MAFSIPIDQCLAQPASEKLPNPNQEANSPAGKGKVSFLSWSVSGYIDYTLGQATCPAVIGQHKTNSMALYIVSFCLIGLLSVLILIFAFLWEVLGLFVCLFLLCGLFFERKGTKQHEVGWGRKWEWGRIGEVENNQNIIYETRKYWHGQVDGSAGKDMPPGLTTYIQCPILTW